MRLPSRSWTRALHKNEPKLNIFLTDMMNISIESFKLLQNEITYIQSKNSFIIIHKDAFLS